MSAVATKPAAAAPLLPAPERPAARLFEPAGGELTLEQAVLGIWDELVREGDAGCPVCGTRMQAASPCGGCGSRLS